MQFDEKTSILDKQALAALGKSPSSRAACFIVIAGRQAGKMYKLERDEIVIGRVSAAGIQIDDEGVSRQHAKIVRQTDGDVVLVDLESTNGTFCNGEKVDAQALQDGDKIQIGSTTILKFSFQDSIEEDFTRQQYESATRDALTECHNKKYFGERLPSEFAFAARHNKMLSLGMIDLDHFKKVNDTYGHLAGDHVLKRVAQLILETVRTDDVVVRYGGEEFALIMRETPPDKAFIAAERIRRAVEGADISFEGKVIPITISVGVATWSDGEPATPDELVKAADEYLYKAKENGRNRTESQALG